MVKGTYVAEQNTGYSYDLISTSPALPMTSSTALPEQDMRTPRQRLADNQRAKQKKKLIVLDTTLPALTNIDPLIGADPKSEESGPQLPLISGRNGNSRGDILSRLFYYPRSPRKTGEKATPVPTDEEFRDWISSPSPTSSRPTPSLDKWYILLMRKTFDHNGNTPEHVSTCLVEILGIDADVAQRKVEEATSRLVVVLQECPDPQVALARTRALQRLGIVVQTTSETGLPAGVLTKKGGVRENYQDLFNNYLSGSDCIRSVRSTRLRVLPPVERRPDNVCWHDREVPIVVVPEDPVAVILAPEENTKEKEVEAPPTPAQAATNKLNKLRSFVSKATGGNASAAKNSPKKTVAQPWDMLLKVARESTEAATSEKREGCQMIRFFVFGNTPSVDARTRDAVFAESIGSLEQVQGLHKMWVKMDADRSGRVDVGEFRPFVETTIKDRVPLLIALNGGPGRVPDPGLPTWAQLFPADEAGRFASRLCDRLSNILLGKKSSMALEDMMKLIWLAATPKEVREMKQWCRDFEEANLRTRVKTPPPLDESEYQGLVSVFRHYDVDGVGFLRMEDLVGMGLLYEGQQDEYFSRWDQNGDGILDEAEFCDMMCPVGFRANSKSEVGSLPDGTRARFDPEIRGWRIEAEQLPAESTPENADAADAVAP